MTSSRSSPVKKSFLLAFLLGIGIAGCLGYSMDISGSSEYAERNKTFTFTCTVNDAVDLSNVVKFYKKKTDVGLVGSLHQSTTRCGVFSQGPSGYVVACGTGTDTSTSSTKTYTLTINNVVDDDAIDWLCGLNIGTRSNTVTLNISVDGGWSEWNTWSTCSVTCGDGQQTRSRTCTNPAPENGGNDCDGETSESKSCNHGSCPNPTSDTWCIRYSILNSVLIVGGVIISF